MSTMRVASRQSPVVSPPRVIDFPGAVDKPPRPPVRRVAQIRAKVVPLEAMRRLRPLVEAAAAQVGPLEPGGWAEALAVCALMYVAPIRATAFGALSWANVAEAADGWAFISTLDKGRREVEAEIAPEQWALLRPLLVKLSGGPVAQDSVPVSIFGAVLDRHQVRRRVQRVTRELAGKRYSAHWLRHTHGCHAAAAGASSLAIAQQLGHGSTDTTERYYVRIAQRGGSARFVAL